MGRFTIRLFLTLVAVSVLAVSEASAQQTPFEIFQANLNAQDQYLATHGLKIYESVELVDEKTARVFVTEDWMRVVTPKDPSGSLNVMFDNWRFSFGSNETGVKLIVVAPDGSVVHERSN